MRSRRF